MSLVKKLIKLESLLIFLLFGLYILLNYKYINLDFVFRIESKFLLYFIELLHLNNTIKVFIFFLFLFLFLWPVLLIILNYFFEKGTLLFISIFIIFGVLLGIWINNNIIVYGIANEILSIELGPIVLVKDAVLSDTVVKILINNISEALMPVVEDKLEMAKILVDFELYAEYHDFISLDHFNAEFENFIDAKMSSTDN